MKKTRKLTKRNIAELVRGYLSKIRMDGLTVEVVDRGVRQEEQWWYVPVRTNKEPRRLYRLYEELAEVECDIEDKENLHVFIVPAGATWQG